MLSCGTCQALQPGSSVLRQGRYRHSARGGAGEHLRHRAVGQLGLLWGSSGPRDSADSPHWRQPHRWARSFPEDREWRVPSPQDSTNLEVQNITTLSSSKTICRYGDVFWWSGPFWRTDGSVGSPAWQRGLRWWSLFPPRLLPWTRTPTHRHHNPLTPFGLSIVALFGLMIIAHEPLQGKTSTASED